MLFNQVHPFMEAYVTHLIGRSIPVFITLSKRRAYNYGFICSYNLGKHISLGPPIPVAKLLVYIVRLNFATRVFSVVNKPLFHTINDSTKASHWAIHPITQVFMTFLNNIK